MFLGAFAYYESIKNKLFLQIRYLTSNLKGSLKIIVESTFRKF